MKAESQRIQVQIQSHQEGSRLDSVLAQVPELKSRSQVDRLIKSGQVRSVVNGQSKVVTKASTKVSSGELYEIVWIPQGRSLLEALPIELDVLYDDDELIAINKPAGLVVHPAAGHASDTLVNALVHRFPSFQSFGNTDRPGIVHRLDKGTSGVLVVAKKLEAQIELVRQFQKRSIDRTYYAVVFGKPSAKKLKMESKLARHPRDRKKFASHLSKGKVAVTTYEVINSFNNELSLLKLKLETGRTHQIRVHLSELGHPVVGDSLYGADSRVRGLKSVQLRKKIESMKRLALHAFSLAVDHPTKKQRMSWSAPWPYDLDFLLEHAGWPKPGGPV